MFDDILEIQLVLKGITTRSEWAEMKNQIYFDFINDNHFEELKNNEILTERLRLANEIDPLIGKYYSLKWVRSNVLHMTEEEIEEVNKQIEAERAASDEEGNIGPVDYDGNQDQDEPPPQQSNTQPETSEEEFHPRQDMSEEDKKLVETMTKILEQTSEELLDEVEDIDE
jgi:hypothetical protein